MALIAGLLGAFVGGRMAKQGALEAVAKDYELRAAREAEQKLEELRAYYQSVYTEVDLFWQSYKKSVGREFNNVSQGAYLKKIAPKVEYFSVYSAEISMLKRTPIELRMEIMRVYQALRTLDGCIMVYSEKLKDFFTQLDLVSRSGQEWPYKQDREKALCKDTEGINKQAKGIDGAIKALLPKLVKEIDSVNVALITKISDNRITMLA